MYSDDRGDILRGNLVGWIIYPSDWKVELKIKLNPNLKKILEELKIRVENCSNELEAFQKTIPKFAKHLLDIKIHEHRQ